MNLFVLVAVLCTGGDANNCQAYEVDYNLSAEDCNHYYTDSGLQELENKLSLYVPNYRQDDQNEIILSCESTI